MQQVTKSGGPSKALGDSGAAHREPKIHLPSQVSSGSETRDEGLDMSPEMVTQKGT